MAPKRTPKCAQCGGVNSHISKEGGWHDEKVKAKAPLNSNKQCLGIQEPRTSMSVSTASHFRWNLGCRRRHCRWVGVSTDRQSCCLSKLNAGYSWPSCVLLLHSYSFGLTLRILFTSNKVLQMCAAELLKLFINIKKSKCDPMYLHLQS